MCEGETYSGTVCMLHPTTTVIYAFLYLHTV